MIRDSTITKYIGRRYSRYTVISFSHEEKNSQYFFLCRCDCGTEKAVRINSLERGHTKSCGCFQRDWTRETHKGNTYSRLPFGVSSRNTVFRRYRQDAERRSIPFNLTLEEFTEIVSKPCYFCGSEHSNMLINKKGYGEFRYSGIDRVDNSIGYLVGNCLSCCSKCNALKNGITKEMIYKLYHLLFPTPDGNVCPFEIEVGD